MNNSIEAAAAAAASAVPITAWLQAGAAIVTMLAAIAALFVAIKAPERAARFADAFRAQAAAGEEKKRLQTQVFYSLLKCRAELLNPDARAAINVVDAVFSDNEEVRDARRLFMEATAARPSNSDLIVERYHNLLWEVTKAVGLGSKMKAGDVRVGWYPEAMGQLDAAALADADEKLARLRGGAE